jgi:epoxyqueuosine reductase QueG
MTEGSTQAEIGDLLAREEISVMGTAAIRRLRSIPQDFSPEAVLTGARSIICYGVPIPKGIIYADDDHPDVYWRYCNMLYRSLDMTSNKLCVVLEEAGHLASPIYSCYPWRVVNREFWGRVPLVYWAQEAGLGKLSRCGLLAHPVYGTRILMGGVITTAGLPPTGRTDGEPCPSDCADCIDACPVNAIAKGGKVNHDLCMRHANSSPLLAHLLGDPAVKERFSFETMVNTVSVDDHASYSCLRCLKACPLNSR